MLDRLLSIFDDSSPWGVFLVVLDLVLVYQLVYRSLLMIRGTRAIQTLMGLLLVTVLYFGSRSEYLGLTALNWVLERFLGSFIVIAVVLFQDDIRRGLSQLGRSRSMSNLSEGEHTHFLEEVVKAAHLMSERRIGALIVIERTASLDEHIVEGVHLDAEVSKELLVALFVPFKASPTHDGAVLIQHGRVMWAGCFLPLSRNSQIEKVLGTRHRAAIGLSEITDAVIVVVSEETGAVSVAFQEELHRGLDAAATRALLQKYLTSDSASNLPRRSRVESRAVIDAVIPTSGNTPDTPRASIHNASPPPPPRDPPPGAPPP
jgi:diadenylate cyclase